MVIELLTLIVVLAILGVAVWLVVTYVPMPAPIRTTIVVVVALLILLWVARYLLAGGGLLSLR